MAYKSVLITKVINASSNSNFNSLNFRHVSGVWVKINSLYIPSDGDSSDTKTCRKSAQPVKIFKHHDHLFILRDGVLSVGFRVSSGMVVFPSFSFHLCAN